MFKDWKSVQLGELVEKAFSGPSPTCEERNIQSEHEWGVLKTTSVTWSGWNAMAHKVLPENYWGQEELEVKPGDIIVTKAGPRHRVGVVAYVDNTIPKLIVSGKMVGLRVKSEICLPDVLAGLLSTRDPQKHLDHRTTGMAESQVNFANSALLQTSLRIPPKEEQEVISSIGRHLDTQIQKTEALIAKLEKVKEGLLHDLLTRGIDENGRLRPSPEQAPELYKESPLGLIPRGWVCDQLKWFVPTTDYGISSSLSDSGEIPVLRMNNFKDGEASLGSLKFSSVSSISGLTLQHGDVLFNRTNSIDHVGRTGIWRNQLPKASFASYLVRLNPDQEKLSPEYLNFWLNINSTKNMVKRYATPGVHQVNVNPTNLRKVYMAAPSSMKEQLKVVDALLGLNKKINKEQHAVAKLKSEKTALMDDLLTGRIRVTPLLDKAQATTPA